jgi:hypothetical protein
MFLFTSYPTSAACSWLRRHNVPFEHLPEWYIMRGCFPKLIAWIAKHHPEKLTRDGSLTAYMYHHMEVRCLMAAIEEAQQLLAPGEIAEEVVGAAIHDGFLRRRLPGAAMDAPLPASLLRAYEAAVKKKTGFVLQLVEKPWKVDQSRAEQSRAEQSRAEQSRAEQSRAERQPVRAAAGPGGRRQRPHRLLYVGAAAAAGPTGDGRPRQVPLRRGAGAAPLVLLRRGVSRPLALWRLFAAACRLTGGERQAKRMDGAD